jgi:hypothetical protein
VVPPPPCPGFGHPARESKRDHPTNKVFSFLAVVVVIVVVIETVLILYRLRSYGLSSTFPLQVFYPL